MSVYGQVVSTLGLYGGPAKPSGILYRRLVISLSFDLQIAGPGAIDFPSTLQSCQDANSGIQIVAYVLDQLGNPADISGASAKVLKFQRPDRTAFSLAGLFLTNGMDGAISYITTESDLVMNGTWFVQAGFLLAGDQKTTRWGRFIVEPNIIDP